MTEHRHMSKEDTQEFVSLLRDTPPGLMDPAMVVKIKAWDNPPKAIQVVLLDHWKKDGATGTEYDHGWTHYWHVKFSGSHWKEMEFRGRAKTVEAAKAMAYNMVLGLWIGMGLKPTKPFQEAETEALRAEVRSLRYDKRMVGYVLRTDEPKAYQRVKHYFKAGR